MIGTLIAVMLQGAPPAAADVGPLYYRIQPVPKVDRTELHITCEFKPGDNRTQTVQLPSDYYGTPDLFRFVTSFEGQAGTVVKAGKAAAERVVEPGPDGHCRIQYVLSYDPKVMDGISFGPNINRSHFYCAGCQWMLRIGDLTVERPHTIEIGGLPAGWNAYSSLGPNAAHVEVKASYEEMITTAIGGGSGEFDRFVVRSKPVVVFVAGEFAIPRAEIFAAVKRIVTLEREWFADFAHPFYVVTVLPRSGIIAGTGIPNLFVCFAKADITRDELNVLIAHEMFHTWLPNKARIGLAKGQSDLRYEWFYEGFTDYFARKILVEAGLLSAEKFADLMNQDLYNLADNPGRNDTFADLLARSQAGNYFTAHKKLSYYRGALIALNWETTIRREGKGRALADFIRDYYRSAAKSDGRIPEAAFFELAANYGIDAPGDLERYIVRGEAIPVPPDALGDQFAVREVEKPAFEPGFEIPGSFKAGKIVGVAANGPAARAGLRDGMELVGMRNSNRFGNGWRGDQPLVVTVRIDGQTSAIEFFPHGRPLRVPRYVAISGGH